MTTEEQDILNQFRPPGYGDGLPLPWVLAILLRGRRAILVVTIAGLAIGVLVALRQPTFYTAGFTFIPQASQDQRAAALSGLASQIGISLGSVGAASQPPQLYADVIESREVLGPVAADTFTKAEGAGRHPLPAILGISGDNAAVTHERTLQVLRDKVVSSVVAARTTGAVTISVRTRWPGLSLAIAERLLDGLNRFNRETRQTQAGAERRFTEQRLTAAETALGASERAMQRFLEGNRQFERSSTLAFEHDRLQRDVMLRQQVVSNLAQQYEDARIREVRDTPVITVIDSPTLPVLPDPRGRIRTVALLGFLGFALGIAFVVLRAGWHRQRTVDIAEPSYRALSEEWQRAKGTIT